MSTLISQFRLFCIPYVYVYYLLRLLVNNVSVVFHCAATVKFDEDLTKVVC